MSLQSGMKVSAVAATLLSSALLCMVLWWPPWARGRPPLPFPDLPLAPEPSWPHLAAALSNFSLPPARAAAAGCALPTLDPWDPAILEHVTEVPVVNCSSRQESLLYTSQDYLHLNSTALGVLGVAREQVLCVYGYIAARYPEHGGTEGYDDRYDMYEVLPKEELVGSSALLSPLHCSLAAQCQLLPSGQRLYENVLLYAPRLPAEASSRAGRLSVVVLVLESLSQMNLWRSLPLTMARLEGLGGVLLRGHHKVADNTQPNMAAVMDEGRVMDEFHRQGWASLLLEDATTWMSSLARVDKVGVTVDFHPAYKALEESGRRLRSSNLAHWLGDTPWEVGAAKEWEESRGFKCQQELPVQRYQVGVIRDFLLMNRNRPTFTHVHMTESTHDDLNMFKHYDKDFDNLLDDLAKADALNSTLFILMGDHGFRTNPRFGLTPQGRTENNMPGVVVVPPAALAPALAASLRGNGGRLTSHWDLQQTFHHVLALGLGGPARAGSGPGASLLRPVPARTCGQAGVPLDYCSCTEGRQALEVARVRGLVEAVMEDMDEFLAPVWGCRPLGRVNVTEASVRVEGEAVMVEARAWLEGSPAVFQVTIQPATSTARVTRVDLYRRTSSCVSPGHRAARPYCVCL